MANMYCQQSPLLFAPFAFEERGKKRILHVCSVRGPNFVNTLCSASLLFLGRDGPLALFGPRRSRVLL